MTLFPKKYMHYIVGEIRNTTGKDAEIFNSKGNILASTLVTPSDGLDVLPVFSDSDRKFVLSEKQDDEKNIYALTVRVTYLKGTDYYLTLYGDSSKDLMLLYNPAHKIAEMLLMQEMKNPLSLSSRKDKTFLFNSLVCGTYSADTVEYIASTLQVNLFASFCVVVLRISPYNNFGEHDRGRQHIATPIVLTELEQYVDNYYNTVVLSLDNEIVLISSDIRPDQWKNIINQIIEKIRTSYLIDINCGISLMVGDYRQISSAYRNASTLCTIAERDQDKNIAVQNEQLIELLLEFIPENIKKEYVDTIFKNSTDKDINDWFDIIRTLNKHNGSIGRSAEELFIHKNTLQYRLNRIREKTGYDPRHSDDAFSLVMALLIRKSLRSMPYNREKTEE